MSTINNYSGLFLLIIIVVSIVISLIVRRINIANYKETDYYKQTKVPYDDINGRDLGKRGEYLVSGTLSQIVDENAKRLYNVYIPTGNGRTTEIDVLYITKYGFIVIENKNYSGWIFGSVNNKQWTQIIYKTKNKFYNPIMQNAQHCFYLSEYLDIPKRHIHSLIVFSDRCVFKDIPHNTDDFTIIHRRDLNSFLAEYREKTRERYSPQLVNNYYGRLYHLTQVSQETKTKHVSDVQSNPNTERSNNRRQ